MLWIDMFLKRKDFPTEYYAFGQESDADTLMQALPREAVMVEWQYHVMEPPVLSSVYLKDLGCDLLLAPWLNPKNYAACVETVKEHQLYGLMLTTWHTLKTEIHGILGCAKNCGARSFVWSVGRLKEETATLLRRVRFLRRLRLVQSANRGLM